MRALLLLLVVLAPAAQAQAQIGGSIPEDPDPTPPAQFVGQPATPNPVYSPPAPRHPFMAPNQRSNIHSDAFQTDTNAWSGPLGRDTETLSSFQFGVCGSVTFDTRGRIVTTCIQARRVFLKLFDPRTLEVLAEMELPSRAPSTNPFQDFAGGGYFYLDNQDRAVVPTTDRHIYVIAEKGDGFELQRSYDLSALPAGAKIISALPDWSGRIWLATTDGVVATLDPATGNVQTDDLGEVIQNSFAVDADGGVYIVSASALYRFDAGRGGRPDVTWRQPYENTGQQKPGQVSAGSGTTPTIMVNGWVSITDNADPMNVVVYKRGRGVAGSREICRQPVFEKGASATDNSLIAAGHSIVVENNYGYTGPTATEQGGRTTPGVERVDIDADGVGCRKVWHSDEISPTLVPKLSLANGLVYVYTQDAAGDPDDPWYLTALDFRTGGTVWKRLVGQGLGFNNNYAPVSIGPDGTAYVGTLGGLTLTRDKTAPLPFAETRPLIAVKASPRRIRARRRVRLHFGVTAPSGGVVAPVQRATVHVGKRTARTGRSGRATIRFRAGRKTKRYAVRVTKAGYRTGHAGIRVRR